MSTQQTSPRSPCRAMGAACSAALLSDRRATRADVQPLEQMLHSCAVMVLVWLVGSGLVIGLLAALEIIR